MKIYTKKGDSGQTSLLGGTRVPKHHIRIEAYGTVDELNSYLGIVRDQNVAPDFDEFLQEIQNNLFTLGSNLASDPEKNTFKLPELAEEDLTKLENSIDQMDQELPALKNFVLPGGHPANSFTHVARCVCRRAERLAVQLSEEAPVEPIVVKYLNRLSDWLFAFARLMTHRSNSEEVAWKPRG